MIGANVSRESRSMTPFLVVFAGQAVSLFGSELVQFALVWWLTQESGGSATTLALASLVGLLPPVFLGPFAGALVDRWSRRAVMMTADGAIALATLALAALFALGVVQVWHVYVLMFVRALGGAFHWPAMQASTTLMVLEHHLSRVAGMSQALRGIAGIAMPPLGALLLASVPLSAILAIDVGTALVAIVPLIFICIPQPVCAAEEEAHPSVWFDLRTGVRFVWGWRGLAILIVMISLLHFFAAPAFSLVPIVVTKTFGGGAFELAWMQSVSGVGLLAGGLLLGAWGGFKRRIVTVLLGVALMGGCIAVVGALPNTAFWVAVGAMFCAGVLAPMAVGSFQAIQQAVVPPEIQGRVFTLARSGMDAMSPLGMLVAGPVADAMGVQGWYLLTGGVVTLMAAGAFFVPALIRLEAERENDHA
ncbi:MAG: MFS transporter [Anaerolineae bacterium]|nr:MFS transporter [Anaerolineae bacterium]